MSRPAGSTGAVTIHRMRHRYGDLLRGEIAAMVAGSRPPPRTARRMAVRIIDGTNGTPLLLNRAHTIRVRKAVLAPDNTLLASSG